jgi:nucleoside-diphosphate-sugar epimerase
MQKKEPKSQGQKVIIVKACMTNAKKKEAKSQDKKSIDEGWIEAVQGCKYVHHVASPFPPDLPKHEDELIIPAREGTLHVLKAAAAAGVKRVVITGSFGSCCYGHKDNKKLFTEEDWTVIDDTVKVAPYMKSKTIAEKAAWAFVASDANSSKMELAITLTTVVCGPVLGEDVSPSILIIKKLMDGSMPGCPNLYFPYVDVRDVASLHLLAMAKPEAAGQRLLASNGQPALSMVEIGKLIKAKQPKNAKKVPSRQVPNFLVYLMSFFDKPVAQILPDLGVIRQASIQKARELLGWKPREVEESILDTVNSLIK